MAVYGNNELFTIYTHDGSTKERAAPSLNHLIERIKIYNEENFNYEIITVQLKK